jgi:hypothetical protein
LDEWKIGRACRFTAPIIQPSIPSLHSGQALPSILYLTTEAIINFTMQKYKHQFNFEWLRRKEESKNLFFTLSLLTLTMSHLFAQFLLFMFLNFLAVRFLTVSHFNHLLLNFGHIVA